MARAWWVALVVLLALVLGLAPRVSEAQRAPLIASVDPHDVAAPVEPPSARGIDERCAEGADLLWRGRTAEAERLAREAIAAAGTGDPSGPRRHVVARCHALLGRALLADGSRDPEVIAGASAALRRAWELEPSSDLVDDLVSAHWFGAGPALPFAARSGDRASPAERAAIALRGGPAVARTLRTTATAGGPSWSVVELVTARRQEIVAVACARARCVAEPLFAAWSTEADPEVRMRSLARLPSVGFVPIERGLALVVAADHVVTGERAPLGRAPGGRIDWEGSTLSVRWLEGGAIAGWSVLTRSRLRAWDRALGDGPPTRLDVRVRWARQRVVIQPAGAAAARMRSVVGLLDPRALACDRCWLGGLRPGHLFLPEP